MQSRSQGDSCGDSCCNEEYLTDKSAKDKPWDIHKRESTRIKELLHGTIFHKLSGRIEGCSRFLGFGWMTDTATKEEQLRLKVAHFCRSRNCTICQWRRSLRWVARFLKAMPAILYDYPSARFLFLTLTVKNCDIADLRSTLDRMNQAWKRLSERKQFPAIGFVKSFEVTKSWDVTYKGAYVGRMGTKTLNKWKRSQRRFNEALMRLETTDQVHPHFHILLMVDPGYFAGKNYLSQKDWTALWQSCLRVDYPPIVNIKAVKPKGRWFDSQEELPAEETLARGIVETVKYTVKPSDLVPQSEDPDLLELDRQWLLQLTKQLEHTRAIALGGIFKNHLSEADPIEGDLIGKSEDGEEISASTIYYRWNEIVQRYSEDRID